MRILGRLCFVFLFLVCNLSAQSPTVTHHQVNGYDVFLINSHRGNSVHFAANVEVGMNHDEPVRTAGISHLFEHIIHEGSAKFPGYGTLNKTLQGLGLDLNAFTSHNQTFYYFTGHESVFDNAIVPYGAMFSQPEWNPETFVRERDVVKNEALEVQRRWARSLIAMMRIHLLREGHWLSKFSIGTQDQLNATTLEDLQAHFHANYVPGSMQLLVTANFDRVQEGQSEGLHPERVLELLAENFVPPLAKGQAAKTFSIPPLSARQQNQRMIEIHTPQNEFKLLLEFQGAPFDPLDQAATEILLDYLNLKVDGSLSDRLVKKGWIARLGVSDTITNKTNLFQFWIELTAEGGANRQALIEEIFSYLGQLRKQGIRGDLLEYLKRMSLSASLKNNEDSSTLNQRVSDRILQGLNPLKAFDDHSYYGELTADRIAHVLESSFRPDQMFVGYMGSDVKAEAMDPIFERRYQILGTEDLIAHSNLLWNSGAKHRAEDVLIQIKTIPLGFDLPIAETSIREVRAEEGKIRWTIRPVKESKVAAMHFLLMHPILDSRDQARLDLLLRAFKHRHRGELSYLGSLQILQGMSVTRSGDIHLECEGEPRVIHDALTWLLKSLWTYEPTSEEIKIALDQMQSQKAGGEEAFTAQIAAQMASLLISDSQSSISEKLTELKKHSMSEVLRGGLKAIVQHQNLRASVVGPWSEDFSGDILQVVRHWALPLTDEHLEARLRDVLPIRNFVQAHFPLAPSKAEGAYGIAQLFEAQPLSLRNWALRGVARELLSSLVFKRNREEQNLGYVHGATFVGSRQGIQMMLYGQTEGLTEAPKIEQGWRDVFSKIDLDATVLEEAKDNIRAVQLELRRAPESLLKIAEEDFADVSYWDRTDVRTEMLKELESITPQEVLRFLREGYRPHRSIRLVTAHRPDCVFALSSLSAVRSASRQLYLP